eukprot:TRINITY_DN5103_c0_g1_i1.p1 TRINITY_DN5103_c0_g1~~TRINITY_DN5103_c0_g1_i1.p1  ORF type:complete len:200 (-),score=35.82 TRINITY_DN5103_c0_g1_i1:58-657(-)
MQVQDYDYLLKILLIGYPGVGKTSLLLRFAEDRFSESLITTTGVDFKLRRLHIGDKIAKLQIWDPVGAERFRQITSSYYRGAAGYLLIYDTTDQSSFEQVSQRWLLEIERYGSAGVPTLLVGSKVDDEDKRQVATATGKDFAEQNNLMFIETSAKTGLNVEEAFYMLSTQSILYRDNNPKAAPTTPGPVAAPKDRCCVQ